MERKFNIILFRGTDLDGDGYPDAPLRYEFTNSKSIVQFPLNFCPGMPEYKFITPRNKTCPGSWGIVVREWKIFMAVSACHPFSPRSFIPSRTYISV